MRRDQVDVAWLGSVSALAFVLSMPVMPSALAASDAPQQPLTAAPAQDSSSAPPASPAEIEGWIRGLSEPVDQEQLGKILYNLTRLTDANEQARLQRVLDEQIAKFTSAPAQPPSVTSKPTEPPAQAPAKFGPEASDEEFEKRIEAMTLWPDATVDDLRDRDEVVSAIAAIPDPDRREKFLKMIEDRERDDDSLVYNPAMKAKKHAPARR